MGFRIILFIFLINAFSHFSIGQGCSDAGFCTMGAMKPDQAYDKSQVVKLKTIDFSNYVALTRFEDVIVVQNLEINVGVRKKSSFQIKLPYTTTIGPLANVSGVGDLSLSFTHLLWANQRLQFSGTIGGKIPTGDGDRKIDGRSLPMYYQPSLGTYDAIIGFSLISRKWLWATGYQHAFGTNGSNFSWGQWKDTEFFETALIYPTSRRLKRGEDVMFRIERNFRFSKFNFAIGLLEIYRINEDTRLNPKTSEREKANDDLGTSKGSALTLIGSGGYNFSTKSALKVVVGRRIIKRHINPDGLSREWVFTLGYQFRF